MRILHIVSSLARISGVMNVIMNYYRHIDRSRVQFDFAYFFEYQDTHRDEIEALGGEVNLIAPPNKLLKYYDDLRDLQDKHAYPIVHIHEPYLVSLTKRSIFGEALIAKIAHAHTTSFSDRFISAIRNRFLCINIRNTADYYFACSNAAGKAIFGENAILNDRYFLLRNAVDLTNFSYNQVVRNEVRSKLHLEDKLVIGHVGRFNAQKNHKFLLSVFSSIIKRLPNAKLLLVGFGPLEEEIKRLANDLSLSTSVCFLGMRNDVPDLLQAMDIFILPSLYEGLPVVGIEAQSTGLPILFADTITSEAGLYRFKYLSLSAEPEVWAEESIKLLNESVNTDRHEASKVLTDSGYNIAFESMRLLEKYNYISRIN